MRELKTCTVYHPFDPAKDDGSRWEHPSAAPTFDTDYRQNYYCPICGLEFGVELAE